MTPITYHTPESYRESEIKDAAFDLRHWGIDGVFMSYPEDIRLAAMARELARQMALDSALMLDTIDAKRPTVPTSEPSKRVRHMAHCEAGGFHVGHRETTHERQERKHKEAMARLWD
jgi:hypothetical protein